MHTSSMKTSSVIGKGILMAKHCRLQAAWSQNFTALSRHLLSARPATLVLWLLLPFSALAQGNPPPVSPCTASSIIINAPGTGKLTTDSCRDGTRGSDYFVSRYRFRAAAKQPVAIEIESASFQTFIYLLAPNGTVLYADRDSGANKHSRIPASGMIYLPVSGSYTIEVTSWKPGAKGDFILRLNSVCNFSIAPAKLNFGAEGGSAKVLVTGIPGCAWNISEVPAWLKIDVDPESPGDLSVAATANTAKPRATSLSIAGQQIVVSQASGDISSDQDGDGIPDAIEAPEKTNPTVRDNDIFSSDRLFVRQMYRDFFGFEGDREGIDSWLRALSSGSLDRARLIEGFFNSNDFQNRFPVLVRIDFLLFQKLPEKADEITRKMMSPPALIADEKLNSPEYMAKYKVLSDNDFIRMLYRNTYAREASQTEVENWVKVLAGGKTRGALLLDFAESPFYKEITASRVTAAMLFYIMLRRQPQPQEFDNWVRSLNSGTTTLKAIEIFMATDAYRSRFLP
jgi:hypothetical protein